ncbi:MAG: hypothetical protein NC405_05990 [Odoribacter sp.]|nr:hypothetical protein [Odoribacter sp.]
MKKIYSMLLAGAVALTSQAATHENMLNSLRSNLLHREILTAPASCVSKAPQAKVASGEWTEWESFGTGTFSIDDGLEAFGAVDSYSGDFPNITVDCRKDTGDESIMQFRLNNIYGGVNIVLDYNASVNQLNCVAQPTGWDYWGMGDLLVIDPATAYQTIYDDPQITEEELQALIDEYNSYNYFIEPMGRFYIYLGYTIEGLGDLVALTDVTFQLDGYADYVPKIDISRYVDPESTTLGSITLDEGVKEVRYGIFEGYMNQHKINAVMKGEQGVVTMAGGDIATPSSLSANTLYSIIAITYEDGEAMEWGYSHFTIFDDEEDKWVSLGMADITLDILEGLVWEKDPVDIKAEIQQSKENPSIYRIVDLYKSNHPMCESTMWTDRHQYLVIDASNPRFVYIHPSDLGVELESGPIYIQSSYYVNLEKGLDPTIQLLKGFGGKLENGVITFPADDIELWSAGWSAFGGTDEAPYTCNDSASFKITLPGNGVSDVSVDADGDAVYYNLQGMRIDNPASGQIVVRRVGGNVTKMIIH